MCFERRRRETRFGWLPIIGVMAGLVLMPGARPAFAQDPGQVDLSAGYLNAQGTMQGWFLQASAQLTPRWSIVGQLDGTYGVDCSGCEPDYRDIAALGGVRFSWHPSVRVSPFWHLLGGVLHSKADGYYYDTIVGQRYQPPFTYTYSVVQPGGGVTVMLTPRFGITTQADLQLAAHDGSLTMFPRASAGAVIRFGR